MVFTPRMNLVGSIAYFGEIVPSARTSLILFCLYYCIICTTSELVWVKEKAHIGATGKPSFLLSEDFSGAACGEGNYPHLCK